MNGSHGSVTRTSHVTAIVLAILMVGVPSYLVGDGTFEMAGNAAAQTDVDRNYIVAVSELTLDTLNPNTYTMVSEGLAIFPLYSYLLQYDVEMNIIGDAAREWWHSSDGLLWNFKLWDNIYFIDPASPNDLSHQLTADDVIYSFFALQDNPSSRLHFYFPGVLEDMWYPEGDPFDLWIQLSTPFASIMDSWVGMPILPAYIWEGEDFVNFDNEPPIGSGPLYYRADNDPDLGSVTLCRNNHWYMTENFGWQLHTDNIIIKEELNDQNALMGLQAGSIDVMLRVSPKMYLQELPDYDNVEQFSFTGGFVYEFNLNQMSDDLRKELGGSFNAGSNNQLLLLEPVKQAFAMSVDKEAFVSQIQYGLGSPACSLIPQGNKWHWEVPEEDKIQVSTTAARELLNANGWEYDEAGNYDPDATPLAREGGTDVLSFRYYTLDTSLDWKAGAQLIANWTEAAGIELNLEIKSVSQLNTIWYAANYDVWLWDWVMGIVGDGAGIMEVLTSMSIGESSDVYWVNETYDSIYNESLYCMDPVYRAELIDQLQEIAYFDMACQCVSYSADNYGVSTVTWNHDSMGDWNTTYFLLPDIWFQWLAMQLYPNDNNAPYFTTVEPDFETTIGTSEQFVAEALDDGGDNLLYRWFWGDGEKTGWSTSGVASHTYTEDGIYDAWVAVREDGPSKNDILDNFTTVAKVTVTVVDMSNNAPTGLSLSYLPAAPDTGDVIAFTGHATDEESDELYYSWDFGGGHWLDGPEVEYQFITEGYHSVTMYVTDNHLGMGERPVSLSETIEVFRNNAPTVDVGAFTGVPADSVETFTVSASDPEDPIRLTWFWGDGSFSVTDEPTATHAYSNKGTYTLTVFVDDLTGLDGHNVSESNFVEVVNVVGNKAPVISTFTVTDNTPYTYQTVTFTGEATDAEGQSLLFTFSFGDGTYAVQSFPATDPNEVVSWSVDHEYVAAGTPTARLYVSDGTTNSSSAAISMTVEANYPPDVSVPDVYGSTGVSTAFTITADDFDGDTLSFYWDWADGTYSVTAGESTTHTYAASGDYEYTVWVNDGNGHNESDSGMATINAIPEVDGLSSFTLVVGVSHTFTASADDADDDTLLYTWEFGDGAVAVGQSVPHAYSAEDTYTCTVHVDDGFPLASHNVSTSCTVTVVADSAYPPEVDPLPERTETVGEVVTFTAHATDPNGDPLTYEWDFGDGSATEMGQTVTHTYAAVNDYTYSVTVCDGVLDTTASNVIHILDDAVPIASAGSDRTVNEDVLVTFDGTGSWDDIGIVNYVWTIPSLSVTLPDNTATPTYTFAEPGVYTVTLEVEDTIGQTDTDDVVITVRDVTPPTAVAVATPSAVDMGGTVTLDGSGSSDNVDVVSWTWEFFDGVTIVTLSGEVIDHVFDNAGQFSIDLTVEDAAGNDASDSVLVTVNDTEDPVAVATADPDPVNYGETVTLDGSGSWDNVVDGIVSWTWDISLEGTLEDTLYGMIVTYEFQDLGDYDVTLTVEDEAENTGSVTIVVTSEDSEDPVAVAAADPTTVDIGGTVSFDSEGSSDNHGIVSYEWDFDDGSAVVTGATAEHAYDEAGTYDVTLTVTDSSGNSATDTVTVTVEAVNEAPTAVATATPSEVEVGDEVAFSAADSTDADGTIESYDWVIMSGSTEVATMTGETATYTFTAAGTYEVTLTVTDDGGLTDTDTVTVTVTEPVEENDPPVAVADADPTTITVGETVTFDGSGSTDSDGTIVEYEWTFTYDGETETLDGETADFTFEIEGTYVVTLTVTDSDGDTDTDTVTITVEADDTKSFIEAYGLIIAAIVAIVVVAVVAMMLMKRKKGGKGASSGGVDGIDSGES